MKKEQFVGIVLVVAMLVVAACAPTQAPEEASTEPIKICFFAAITSGAA